MDTFEFNALSVVCMETIDVNTFGLLNNQEFPLPPQTAVVTRCIALYLASGAKKANLPN